MKLFNVKAGVLSGVAAALLATAPTQSQDSQWANQSFLTDYSTLKPIPGKEGKDYRYLKPDIETPWARSARSCSTSRRSS